jgi:molybdate transport system substrate-binding protein
MIVLAAVTSMGQASVVCAENVTVFAAASLTDAMKTIGQTYEREVGEKVDFNFGASSDLARQIKAGAPADVFFSADASQMDVLVEAGLVSPSDRKNVLSNSLVVIVPRESTATVRVPADLTRFEHVAIANPDAVPAGVYAREYLQGLRLWDAIEPRVVPTVDVRAALAAVADEHAEVGVVYRTDAAISPKVKIAFDVPREQTPAIVYPLAPLTSSRNRGTSAVVRYLVSPAALRAYEQYGFVVTLGK